MPIFIKTIISTMKKFPRDNKKYINSLKANKLEVRSAPGVRSVTFTANMQGEMDGPYLTSCRFFNIDDFKDNQSLGYIKTKVANDVVYAKKPSIDNNPVQIKCSCDDFRFRFEHPLFKNKGLIGSFRKYVRKTPPPPLGRPFANPSEYIGFCKHVHNLLRVLKLRKLIK